MAPDEQTIPAEDTEIVGREDLAADLPAVFKSRDDAPLPEIYEHAKRAIQTCERVVKAKEYERSARALEELGRMAEDHELVRKARQLRLYATRKAGEILREFRLDPEENLPRHRRDKGARPSGDDRPTTQREAAEEAGLSKHQERQARRVAEVPVEEFVSAVESNDPPSVTAMAERGMMSRGDASPEPRGEERTSEPTSRESAAETLREALNRFEWWCRVQDATDLREEFEPDEIEEAAEKVGRIIPWLRRFCARAGEADSLPESPEHLDENGHVPDEAGDDPPRDAADMDQFLDGLGDRDDDPAGDRNGEDEEQEGCRNCGAYTRPGETLCAHCSAHGLGEEDAS